MAKYTTRDAPLKDVPQGLVHYLPKTPGSGRQASGRIQPDGSFELTTFKKADGVVPGEYDIAVSAYSRRPRHRASRLKLARRGVPRPRLMIPEKYIEPDYVWD